MEPSAQAESSGAINTGDITMGPVGIRLPVTSGIDPSANSANTTVTGAISVPSCSAVDGSAQQQAQQQQQQQIQIPGGAMSISGLAVAMGLSGANTDPNSLAFTSNALASLSARMGMTSMAGGVGVTNAAGLMAANPGNSLVTFPGGNAASTLNLVPGVNMNIAAAAAAAGAGVSIVDGGALSMAVSGNGGAGGPGGMVMAGNSGATPTGISVVGVQASGEPSQQGITNSSNVANTNVGGNLLTNNIHMNSNGQLVNNMGGGGGGGHSAGGCCGGCRTRVTVKDQSSQTDLSTVIQVKAEERLARSGLMPGARLISHSPGGTTISHANPNSHHGPNFPCSCDFCGRMFAKKEYLRRHVRIHTGERPYKCVICGHSFRRSHHLRCHELTHTGTKPYTCGICGKAFNLSHHLRRHEMTHTGEKPYACTECDKAFTRKQHLDRHYKTHTGEYHRTFKCPFCEKMFFRAHHRDKHMKRHVLTTPDLTAATFSPVNNMNLSIRSDGTLRADGINSSPISVGSKDDSHSSEDYLTSDEEGKPPNANKPKEGSKKRKGSSPIRLRFPYDYNATKSEGGGSGVMLHGLKNMSFPIPHGVGASGSTGTILTTPTRGRPKGSKNKNPSNRGKKKAERAQRAQLMTQLTAMEMKTEQQDMDGRDAYGGVKKDEDARGGVLFGAGGKTIPNVPSSQFESVVVRHPLDSNNKGAGNKDSGSTPGPAPTPPIHDGTRGGGAPQLQWQGQAPPHQQQQQQQQQVMNPGGTTGNDAYMSGQTLGRQLHTPGPNTSTNNGGGDQQQQQQQQQQQTMHYKPPTTPDNQSLHHAWPVSSVAGGNWPPRIALSASDLSGRAGGGGGVPAPHNTYNQVDASHFMNIYSASKVMEMRMADLRGQPQGFDGTGGQWNQGRQDPNQDKSDNRIYTMHQ